MWTLSELVTEAAARIAALPAPKNGQVRAVPDERTVRYYGTLGLLDRPSGARGRTALYGPKHLAQIVAIKRLQAADKTIAEIKALWPTLDAATLQRMSGVELPRERGAFWKRAPASYADAIARETAADRSGADLAPPGPAAPAVAIPIVVPQSTEPVSLRVEVSPGVSVLVTLQLIRTEPTP